MPPVIPAEQELQLNPVTGEMEAVPVAAPATNDSATPVRSWVRSDQRPNAWDQSFEYEGAKVLIKALSKDQRNALKDQEKVMNEKVATLQTHATGNADEKLNVTEQIADIQMDFFAGVVRTAVRGWENGPLPYSPEILDELSLEILVDWAQTILEKSMMGRAQAEFLKNS